MRDGDAVTQSDGYRDIEAVTFRVRVPTGVMWRLFIWPATYLLYLISASAFHAKKDDFALRWIKLFKVSVMRMICNDS